MLKTIQFKTIGFPILSGILIFLSFPKWNLWFLAWVSLVPLFFAIENQSPVKSFYSGWIAGLTAFCGILYWIVPTFKAAGVFLPIGIIAVMLLSGYIALFYGCFAAFTQLTKKSYSECFQMVFYGSLWVALEYVRTHFFTGFPWGALGYSQWKAIPLIQISEWTGVYGVSALLILINFFIYRLIQTKKFNPKLFAVLLIPLILTFLLGMKTVDATNTYNIQFNIIQGNINQYKKWSKSHVVEILETYRDLTRRAAVQSDSGRKIKLIVWPETAVPGWIPNEENLLNWVEVEVKKSGMHHLIGSVTKSNGKNYNSAFLFSPDGKIIDRYDKMHLVPFGEYVPLKSILGSMIPVLNELGGFSSGRKSSPIKLGNSLFGVNICYEAIFPNLIRSLVRDGAQVIVNITNDGWYLDTAAPEQHFSMNVFRAVENRRYLVRAANTGLSGIIDPKGNIQTISKLNKQALLVGSLSLKNEKTFYTKFGDVFSYLSCLLVFCGILYHHRKMRSAT